MKRIDSLVLLLSVAAAALQLPAPAQGTITGQVQSSELREVSGIPASRMNPGVV